ncbi:peptidase family C50-domain-containing protein [Mucidula mucida]|nr:peptidase family C50-domain-containing protein [Mucidula mucida]
MPPSTLSRRPTSRKPATSVNDLADQLAAGLTITNAQENESRSGWKYRKDAARGSKFTEANSHAAAAATHLSVLRQLCPDDVDIERAAMSVLSKLASLEMYEVALPALSELHSSLCKLLGIDSTSLSSDRRPPNDNTTKFANVLRNEYSLISWLPILSHLPSKHVDFLLTRSYSVLNKSIPVDANPREVFYIRMHAVCYLAYTSPGTVGNPDAFWDQPYKSASSYMKALLSKPTTSSVQDEAASVIVQAFSQVVNVVHDGNNSANLLQGKLFLAFCEYWMELANRIGDVVLLDRIVALIQRASSTSATLTPTLAPAPTSATFNISTLCANLTRTSAVLDSYVKSESSVLALDDTVISLNEFLNYLRIANNIGTLDNKTDRAFERLRRAGVKALETTSDSPTSEKLGMLLSAVVDILETVISLVKTRTGRVTKALDTLFDCIASHNTLSRAVRGVQPNEEANFWRCVSGAFHNLGGQLYQSGKHGSAISFLDDGCRLATKALHIFKSTAVVPDDPEPWNQLSNQLYRRWQLLALCCAKIGDRKPAYQAFTDAIRTFPYAETDFVHRAASTPPHELFESSPALKELASIVDKVTYQGLCDLMLPAEKVSLHNVVEDPYIVGALLERQIESLEPFLQKSTVASAIPVLVNMVTDLYASYNAPIRRVRVLLRCLALGYTNGPDAFNHVGKPDRIVADIEHSLKEPKHDGPLAVYAQQYRALALVWRAMHIHRRADERQVALIADCANAACGVLRVLLTPESTVTPTQKISTQSRVAKLPAASKTRAKKRAPLKVPVTPRPRQRKALQDVPLNITVTPDHAPEATRLPTFDQPLKLLDVLQSLVHILGFLSLLVPKVSLLDVMRRLAEQTGGTSSDQYISVTVQLASEHVRLALQPILPIVKQGQTSPEAALTFFLRFAEASSVSENFEQSSSLYDEAIAVAGHFDDDKSLPAFQRAQIRTHRIEKVAMAFNVFATLQMFRDDVAASLDALLQSLRLWNRAFDALSRLQPTAVKASEDDPFQDSPEKTLSQPKQTFAKRSAMTSSGWRISEGLLGTFFALCQAYTLRGSQAEELAIALNAPAMAARALTRKAELQFKQGLLDDGYESLGHALRLLQEVTGGILQQLEQTFGVFDGLAFGTRRSTGGPEVLVPDLLTKLLSDRIWRLRDETSGKADSLLESLLSLPSSSETKAEENSLIAKLTLHGVYKRFRGDMFLSSLPESTIALPLGTSKAPALSGSSQDILKSLDHTEELFWSNLELTCRRGNVSHVREAAVRLALVRAFQASLGKPGADETLLTTNLLDASSAVTLRREMGDAILHKFQLLTYQDDLEFPSVVPLCDLQKPRNSATRRLVFDDSDEEQSSRSLKDFWLSVQKRYQEQDRSTMFISRQYGGDTRRRDEDNDDEHLTFHDVIAEFQDIVRSSNETTKVAVHIKSDDEEARTKWWKERGALDTRLRDLLENLEFCWLGAFKTILSQRPHLHFDTAFQRGLHLQDKKTKQQAIGHRKLASDYQLPNRVTLDDALMECFSTLSIHCRDEELEDLVYFMLDFYQFHGIPVAIAEIDSGIGGARNRMERRRAEVPEDDHVFLVLDKDIQGLPWENIPILRGRSVSRIPNVEFLLDRVEFARWRRGESNEALIDRAVVDPRKGYYILNPSGDLGRTEERFKSWAKDMESVGWQGISGRAPSELQFLNALQNNDLVVYFGHGGGEQYVRSHKIRHLSKCAAVMLWGCSSGFLREMGDFDRIGSPYNYMVAGCPTLVANLWDVTDRDIDKFSQAVFDEMHLESSRIKQWTPDERSGSSIVTAVARSRDVCKLKYLTGAAPVVYGIPFYL